MDTTLSNTAWLRVKGGGCGVQAGSKSVVVLRWEWECVHQAQVAAGCGWPPSTHLSGSAHARSTSALYTLSMLFLSCRYFCVFTCVHACVSACSQVMLSVRVQSGQAGVQEPCTGTSVRVHMSACMHTRARTHMRTRARMEARTHRRTRVEQGLIHTHKHRTP